MVIILLGLLFPAMSNFLLLQVQMTMQQRFLGFGAFILQYLVAVVRRVCRSGVMAFASSLALHRLLP